MLHPSRPNVKRKHGKMTHQYYVEGGSLSLLYLYYLFLVISCPLLVDTNSACGSNLHLQKIIVGFRLASSLFDKKKFTSLSPCPLRLVLVSVDRIDLRANGLQIRVLPLWPLLLRLPIVVEPADVNAKYKMLSNGGRCV